MNNIIITFEDGVKLEYRKGIKLSEIIKSRNLDRDIICGSFQNRIINYDDAITRSGTLTLYDINSSYGNRIYEKGLTVLFKISALEVLGKDISIKIRHSIDRGIFFEIDKKVSDKDIEQIKKNMMTKVEKAIPFIKIETTIEEAMTYFKSIKRDDKIRTLFYDKNSYVTLYKFDGVYNYVIGNLPYDSSILKYFDLTNIPNKGIILRYPSIYDNGKILKYTHHDKFFNNIDEYLEWARILNISSIGELNDTIISSKPGELINLSESIQNYRLQQIAGMIKERQDEIKIILLSGPSSSGKTTTSRKLSMYLKTLGLNPVAISLDDYFLNRDETPINENGKPDYESLRAIDVKLFNNQMSKLLKGSKVTAPTFNFIEGRKIFDKNLQMKENDILIVEGLHAISEDLLKDIPKNKKFKIYLSPLVYLNIDDDNRINLTDIRLLRRMVRDNRTRGYNSSKTLSMWKEVRDGEEKYVFKYQDQADIIFNTFLAYELPVLKVYAEPLLYQIKEDDPEYLTAVRLIKLLDLILPLPSEDVPSLSILREFIGTSYFER
ncbi:MAG: nucleoside kinase [Bacilli bacterium]|nr:nucleoside kinase [Bacilli bacterium]